MIEDYLSVGRWFSILHRRSQLFVVEACQRYPLTFSEYVVLMSIFQHEGAKQDELGERLYLDKAVVTRTVNMLQEKGFIYREVDLMDRRVRHIFPTEYARSQHAYLNGIVKGWIDYLVEGLPEGEAEMIFHGFNELVDKACEANLVKLAKDLPQDSEC